MKDLLITLILVLFVFSSCKNERKPKGFIGSVNKENQFVPIEGMIDFKFKTEDSLELTISRINHKNNYCSLSLHLVYKEKVIDQIRFNKLFQQCNPEVILKQDFKSLKSVVLPNIKTEIGLLTFKLANGSTYDLLVGQSNRKLLKLEEDIVFNPDQNVENTLTVKDTSIVYSSKIINKISNTAFSNTTKTLEVLGDGILKEQKAFPVTKQIYSHTFKKNPSYAYSIVETKHNWRTSVYKSLLKKDGIVVDSNILERHDNYIETLYTVNEIKATYTDISIDNVEELVEITNNGLGETWDGYAYSNMLFGYTKNNTLINELFTDSEGGNTESDYSRGYMADERFNIPNSKTGFNNRLIINKIGSETFYNVNKDDQEGKTNVFYNIDEVYDFKNGQFIIDITTGYNTYVTAKNGLSVRSKPGFTERLEKLEYNTEVSIIARSKIDFTLKEANNKTIIGRWCKIRYNNGKLGYVFDGYLSENKTP
ncbi:SH3 domain-containing protein [Lacinutrix sp.]|uniref:SH3 domain-containing protein n=1 Tax=Lacinutrix sp. TaxID=1937692 RepID=UPI0025BEECBC|nr:SH3 domain-containing protein [Lacinutrix sp.]